MKMLLLTLVSSAFFLAIQGQAGNLDLSFGTQGFVRTGFVNNLNTHDHFCREVLLRPDGSFYLVFEVIDRTYVTHRLSNGALDLSYGQNGYSVPLQMINARGAIQPDLKVVVSGDAAVSGNRDFTVARLNTNGFLDNSFSGDGIQTIDFFMRDDYPTDVALQTDGRIVIAGYSYNSGIPDFALARLLTDGSLDNSFSGDGRQLTDLGASESASALAVQNTGRIVLTGSTSVGLGVIVYLTDGTLDNSFSGDGIYVSDFMSGRAVAIQNDGKIVIGGISRAFSPDWDFFVIRFNPDGTLDNSFSGDGMQSTDFGATNDFTTSLVIQNDGKIVAGGSSGDLDVTNQDFAVARYNADGSPDISFSGDGKLTTSIGPSFDDLNSIVMQPDGKLLGAGNARLSGGLNNYVAVRYNQDGGLDNTFDGDGILADFKPSFTTTYSSSAVQPDGKIVTVGTANNNIAIVRYNMNGTLDNSFSGDGMTIVDFGSSGGADVAIQADGKIVVVGSAFQDIAVARLNPDGSLDNTFSGDGKLLTNVAGFFDSGRGVELQADGKIVVLGTANFAPFRAQNVAVIRYNPDGTLDPSFSGTGIRRIGFSSADIASDMLIQPDGKIVFSATVNFENPSNLFIAVARLNNDGSSDASFNGGSVIIRMNVDFAGPLALQSDGKIVMGGSTGTPTGRRGLLFRFNTNGSFDNSFSGDGILFADPTSGIGGFGPVTIQPDGKIIAGSTVGGVSSSDFAILRFNPDGTPDNSFAGDGMVTADFENGNDALSRFNIWNNRLYGVGTTTIGVDQMGIVAAFLLNEVDTGMLTCPGNRVTNVEPGLCSAVINNIDPILNNPGSTVDYILTGATVWNGTGSVSGFRFPAGLTTVTYRLTNDPTKSCSFTLDISDHEFPQGNYPPVQNFCFNSSNNYSLPLLQATDNCGIRSIEYEISGATTRSGGGNNASGFLSPGMNQIKWTIKDISFNTKIVTGVIQINPPLTVTIPDVVSLLQGVKPNTVYIGYPPAAYVTLQAQPSGGAGFYATHWSDGSAATWNTVHPVVQTTYTVTITDLAGCSASASKMINVIDVRCGDQNNKVVVCKPDRNLVCVDFWTVADLLANGAALGNCNEELLTRTPSSNTEKEVNSGIAVYPNPSQHEFRISLKTGSRESSELIIRDQIGRLVERIWIKPNQMITVGSSYQPGFYFAEVIQGSTKFTAKLIKQ